MIEVTTAAPALAAGVPRERYRFVYDSRSRRIARTVESWDLDAGAWVLEKNERFVHDAWNVVAVVDAAGAVVQRYVWGNDLSGTAQGAGGVGGLLAASDAASGRSWCYAYDGNGNVSAVVDLADGAKVGWYDYDAFGRTIASWVDEGLAGVNVYRFSTKPMEGTGLYYYGYRWFEPETGRWVSRDPIGERGGWNLQSILSNTQINRIDFLGLQSQLNRLDDVKLTSPSARTQRYPHGEWDESRVRSRSTSQPNSEEICSCLEVKIESQTTQHTLGTALQWRATPTWTKEISEGGKAPAFVRHERAGVAVTLQWKTDLLPRNEKKKQESCDCLLVKQRYRFKTVPYLMIDIWIPTPGGYAFGTERMLHYPNGKPKTDSAYISEVLGLLPNTQTSADVEVVLNVAGLACNKKTFTFGGSISTLDGYDN